MEFYLKKKVLNFVFERKKYFTKINTMNKILFYFQMSDFRITKMFAANKEDRKRVEKALDATGLPSGKVRMI